MKLPEDVGRWRESEDREGRTARRGPLGIDLVRVERRWRLWEGVGGSGGVEGVLFGGGWEWVRRLRARSSSLRPLAGARLLCTAAAVGGLRRAPRPSCGLWLFLRDSAQPASRSVAVDRGERSLAPLSPVGLRGLGLVGEKSTLNVVYEKGSVPSTLSVERNLFNSRKWEPSHLVAAG